MKRNLLSFFVLFSCLVSNAQCTLRDSITSTCATCCNCIGTTHIYVWGGTKPYTYSWSNGRTNDTLNSLPSGTYACTVTDSSGCTITDTVFVHKGEHVSTSQVNILCFGGTGSASVSTDGDDSYSWSPSGGTNNTATGLSAGTYTVTLTNKDTVGCSASYTFTITQPTPLNVSAVESISNCHASATASVFGGNLPYTYLWSPSGGTNAVATGLSGATYTIYVTDNNGCTVSTSVIITIPVVPTGTVNVNSNPCNLSFLDLQAVVTGGKAPYTYAWEYGSNLSYEYLSPNFTCPFPITDYIIVTDNNGCSTTINKSVNIPIEWEPPAYLLANITCYGENNGSITMNICDGTGSSFKYSWNSSSANSGNYSYTASNLSAGTYTINVMDIYFGCTTQTYTVTITQPPALIVSASVTSNVTCNIGNNGSATSTVSGGTSPYTYLWSGGNGTNSAASSLTAGTYTLNVTDKHGCTNSATVTITEPSIRITTTTIPSTCAGPGSATAFPLNGFSPYTYSWSGGGGTNGTATGLSVGTYTVNVADSNGCTGSAIAVITQPTPLNVSANTINNVSCNGGNNGSASSSVSGGTSPYTYSWSNGQTTANISNLSMGTYTLNVTDNMGCMGSATSTITQPTAITIQSDSVADNGGCNGKAWVAVGGGVPPLLVFMDGWWNYRYHLK